MRIKILLTISMVLCWATMDAQTRQWGVLDGLPTGEVRQIIVLAHCTHIGVAVVGIEHRIGVAAVAIVGRPHCAWLCPAQ